MAKANKKQMSGMHGVFLVAAELSARGFIVSPTSRSAKGADLLVTDQECRKAWSVQVKTNGKPTYSSWMVGPHAMTLKSDSHVYVFVNLQPDHTKRPLYIVAASRAVAEKTIKVVSKTEKKSVFYYFRLRDRPSEDEGWSIFGDPHAPFDETTEADDSGNLPEPENFRPRHN
jgi:hypothetical protein